MNNYKVVSLNINEFNRTTEIAERVEFLELAINPKFQDCFVDNLGF